MTHNWNPTKCTGKAAATWYQCWAIIKTSFALCSFFSILCVHLLLFQCDKRHCLFFTTHTNINTYHSPVKMPYMKVAMTSRYTHCRSINFRAKLRNDNELIFNSTCKINSHEPTDNLMKYSSFSFFFNGFH